MDSSEGDSLPAAESSVLCSLDVSSDEEDDESSEESSPPVATQPLRASPALSDRAPRISGERRRFGAPERSCSAGWVSSSSCSADDDWVVCDFRKPMGGAPSPRWCDGCR